jgi:MacB-like protein
VPETVPDTGTKRLDLSRADRIAGDWARKGRKENSVIARRQPGACRAASLIFGLVPALHASRSDLNDIVKGRDFAETDNQTTPLVAIVNEAVARAAFPGADAIGRRIRSGYDGTGFMEIVGVVANLRAVDRRLDALFDQHTRSADRRRSAGRAGPRGHRRQRRARDSRRTGRSGHRAPC